MNRRRIIVIIGVISLILSGFISFFIIFPMMILPSEPASLFYISNHDDMNHTVSVEIFDSENNSIFFESFEMEPNDFISFDRGLDWCPKNTFYWLFWSEGSYYFFITLDDSFNGSHYTELYPLKSVWITITSNDSNPLQIHDAYCD